MAWADRFHALKRSVVVEDYTACSESRFFTMRCWRPLLGNTDVGDSLVIGIRMVDRFPEVFEVPETGKLHLKVGPQSHEVQSQETCVQKHH